MHNSWLNPKRVGVEVWVCPAPLPLALAPSRDFQLMGACFPSVSLACVGASVPPRS